MSPIRSATSLESPLNELIMICLNPCGVILLTLDILVYISNFLASAYGRNNYDNWMKKHQESDNIV